MFEKAYRIWPSLRFSINKPDRISTGTGAFRPTLARPDPDPGELSRQLPFGSLTPGHLLTRQALSQGFQAHRSRVVFSQTGPLPGAGSGRSLLGPVPAGFLGEDDHLRCHPRDVEQPPLFQPLAERLGDPVAGIGDDPATGPDPREAFVKEVLFSDVPFSTLCPFFPPAVRKDPHRVPVTTAQDISYLAMMLSGGKTMVDD
jgi:hypothetical protein